MKKFFRQSLISFLSLVVLTTLSPLPAFAQVAASNLSGTPTITGSRQVVRATITAKTDQDRITDLKTRATDEINRRVAALNIVLKEIANLKRLSDTDKATLTTQVQSQIDSLTKLNTTIQSDTDLVTLKKDVQSIIAAYRIFAFYVPQIHILASADAISDVSVQMATLQAKLQAKVQEASAAGKDTAALQLKLSDMTEQITNAKTVATNVETTVSALTPAGYPGNKVTLISQRKALVAARQDLAAARADIADVISGLKSPKALTPSVSPTK